VAHGLPDRVSAPSLGIGGRQHSNRNNVANSGVVTSHRKAARENVLFGYIVDPDTGKIVAVIRHGEVFRNDKEEARIAIVLNANLYDLNGNLVGRLDGQNVIDVRTWSMPIAFRNLLQGANPIATEKPADGLLTVNWAVRR